MTSKYRHPSVIQKTGFGVPAYAKSNDPQVP